MHGRKPEVVDGHGWPGWRPPEAVRRGGLTRTHQIADEAQMIFPEGSFQSRCFIAAINADWPCCLEQDVEHSHKCLGEVHGEHAEGPCVRGTLVDLLLVLPSDERRAISIR